MGHLSGAQERKNVETEILKGSSEIIEASLSRTFGGSESAESQVRAKVLWQVHLQPD